jgi:hypothetical protein
MITELTPEQAAKMPEYVKTWTAKGATTRQRTLEDAQIDFARFQQLILQKETPAEVFLLQSPKKCWDLVNELMSKKAGREVKLKFIYPYFDCQFWAAWFGFYEFFRVELGIEYPNLPEYLAFLNCQEYGMVFPLDEACIVCQPPTILKTNERGLHSENGPAVSYGGDNELYALNGTVMKKEYVLTPAEQIDPLDVLRESNVDVRRELLRKVGIERMLQALPHTLLDKVDNYELYNIDLSQGLSDVNSDNLNNARFLKMLNPSIGVYHMEGVAPGTATVAEALKWRNQNLFVNADVLT